MFCGRDPMVALPTRGCPRTCSSLAPVHGPSRPPQNTVEAYGRALEDHLRFCGSVGADPLQLRADLIAAWIGNLHQNQPTRGESGAS